jgi:hypothetical protein
MHRATSAFQRCHYELPRQAEVSAFLICLIICVRTRLPPAQNATALAVEAEQSFRTAVSLAPDDAVAVHNLGHFMLGSGERALTTHCFASKLND